MNDRAVIFDLDGTLADTLEDIADNMNRVLAGKGFPTHEYDAYRFYVGNGLRNMVAECLPESARNDAMITACHDRMVAEYNRNYINKTRLYDGIPELLDALSSQRIKLALLSNKADLLTQKICGELLTKWKFEAVLGDNERFPRKPDPAAALFVSEQIGIAPANICYLGDSDVDMKTANAAGFYPVGAGWGFRPKEELAANGAKRIIDHPMDLLEMFSKE
ncbi:MAG: HAD family hydrolase [Bacteroidales bacterium]|jgi:phosphoglycolate phosphatase|nr:HAD family hydrolase [Bacteroidales bacterium]